MTPQQDNSKKQNPLAHLKRDPNIKSYDAISSDCYQHAILINFKLSHAGDGLFSNYITDNPRSKKKDVHEALLRCLEANLYSLLSPSEQPYFTLPTSFDRLKEQAISHDILKSILNWLTDKGYIKKIKSGNSLTHKLTCYKLLKTLELTNFRFDITSCQSIIEIKDKEKNLIKDTSGFDTEAIKRNLERINKHLHTATLYHQDKPIPTCLKRVFSQSSLSLHGRFYSNFMNIKSDLRKGFTIDGEKTVVLDFTAMSIRMLYAKENVMLDRDPYTTEGYERHEVKSVFKRMLNTKNPSALSTSLKKHAYDEGLVALDDQLLTELVNTILTQHPSIQDYFFPDDKDSNLIVMHLESSLVEAILLESTKHSLVMFPVHDAFIIKESDKDKAKALIEECFNARYPNLVSKDLPLVTEE